MEERMIPASLLEFVVDSLGIDPERITLAELGKCIRGVQEWADGVIGLEETCSADIIQDEISMSTLRTYMLRKLAVMVFEDGKTMISAPKEEVTKPNDYTVVIRLSVPFRAL